MSARESASSIHRTKGQGRWWAVVDPHKQTGTAAAVDELGAEVAHRMVPARPAGASDAADLAHVHAAAAHRRSAAAHEDSEAVHECAAQISERAGDRTSAKAHHRAADQAREDARAERADASKEHDEPD